MHLSRFKFLSLFNITVKRIFIVVYDFTKLTLFPSKSRSWGVPSAPTFSQLLLILGVRFGQNNIKSTPQNKVAQQLVDLHGNLWRDDAYALNKFKIRFCFLLVGGGL